MNLCKFLLHADSGAVIEKYFLGDSLLNCWIQAAACASLVFASSGISKITCARKWSVVKEVKREDREVSWDIVPSLLRL